MKKSARYVWLREPSEVSGYESVALGSRRSNKWKERASSCIVMLGNVISQGKLLCEDSEERLGWEECTEKPEGMSKQAMRGRLLCLVVGIAAGR